MLRTHRFAQSDVQFLALLLTDGDNTMVRTYALAVAIALAGSSASSRAPQRSTSVKRRTCA